MEEEERKEREIEEEMERQCRVDEEEHATAALMGASPMRGLPKTSKPSVYAPSIPSPVHSVVSPTRSSPPMEMSAPSGRSAPGPPISRPGIIN